jgi:hypothetical protein
MKPDHCRYGWRITGWPIVSILCLFVLLSACSRGPQAGTATETPLPTATQTNTPSPSPTITHTPEPSPTATATITATPDSTGTAVAKTTATARLILDYMQADLEDYDITLDSGYLAWFSNKSPVINLQTYGEERYQLLEGLAPLGDFLLQSEINWDTSTGLAGCGFILRSADDVDRGEQYRFAMMRLENMPGWDIEYHNYGEWQSTITLNNRLQFSNAIHDERKSTNVVAILVKGDQFTVFLNGQEMRTLTNNKLSKGLIAVFGWQESGTSRCEFHNTWVWSFDEN